MGFLNGGVSEELIVAVGVVFGLLEVLSDMLLNERNLVHEG